MKILFLLLIVYYFRACQTIGEPGSPILLGSNVFGVTTATIFRYAEPDQTESGFWIGDINGQNFTIASISTGESFSPLSPRADPIKGIATDQAFNFVLYESGTDLLNPATRSMYYESTVDQIPIKIADPTTYRPGIISPNGEYIVFEEPLTGDFSLNRVVYTSTGLSTNLTSGESDSPTYLQFSDDSQYFFFNQAEGVEKFIYSVRMSDLQATRFSGNTKTTTFNLQPLSNPSQVVYISEENSGGINDIYHAFSDIFNSSTKISITMLPSEETWAYAITPDETRVVYITKGGLPNYPSGSMVRVISVPINGGSFILLDNPQGTVSVSSLRTTDDYFIYTKCATDCDIFSVPVLGGSSPIQLNSQSFGGSSDFYISDDEQWVVAVWLVGSLYSFPIGGGLQVDLGNPGSSPSATAIAPSSSHVIFVSRDDTTAKTGLFIVPIRGGNATELTDPLLSYSSGLTRLVISDNSQWVLFKDNGSNMKLYSVMTGISSGNRLVNWILILVNLF